MRKFRKSVLRIPNKSRISQRGSREDTGHSKAQVMKKNGTERTPTNLKENGIPSLQKSRNISTKTNIQRYQCSESWNSEKKRWQRYHTLRCGFIEHRALVSHDSLSKSGQYRRSSIKLAQWTPNQKELTVAKSVAKENEQLLKNVKPQEVNSLVRTPMGHLETDCENNFRDLQHWRKIFSLRVFVKMEHS